MIPMVLVTGFLGSGKTTYLSHLTRQYADRRLLYLVNEFSAVDVDGGRLPLPAGRLVAVPGGSIFCKCLVAEFIGHLSRIAASADAASADAASDGPLEGVVIEASGAANPKVIQTMLRETKLDSAYTLTTVVSMIDPRSFPKLLKTLPNIRAQVEASDVAILNKCDLYDEATLASVEALARDIRADLRVVRAVRGAVDLELFGDAPARALVGEYAKCADPNYATFEIRFDSAVDWPRLRADLSALGDGLYRAKGMVPTDEGQTQVDFSGSGWDEVAGGPGSARGELVVIASGASKNDAQALTVRAATGAYDLD